jgi:uncharacterized protein
MSSCQTNNVSSVVINDEVFKVEIADSQIERTKGLMFRSFLPKDQGMLFIFENTGRHSFWMKNTKISLDIIWIDEDSKIVHIHNEAEPCKEEYCNPIYPSKDAKYVLELNAGIAESLKLEVGNQIKIKLGA